MTVMVTAANDFHTKQKMLQILSSQSLTEICVTLVRVAYAVLYKNKNKRHNIPKAHE